MSTAAATDRPVRENQWPPKNDGTPGEQFDPEDLDLPMGKPELAYRSGYPLRTVHKWDQRGNLPHPDAQTSSMNSWRWSTLLLFLFATDRTGNLTAHDYAQGLALLDRQAKTAR